MSGGVGLEPTYKEEEEEASKSPKKAQSFLSFRQLNSLALIIILSATGMVYTQDIAFVILSALYCFLFLSKFAFPRRLAEEPPIFDPRSNKLLRVYVSVGALIGLLLPIAYICEGIYEGDKEGIMAATPHLFLLASQVFMEGVAFSGRFSTPIRVFVPVSYNALRIGTIMEWVGKEFSKEFGGGNSRRVYTGRGLAVANMVFWGFNLLGFLLPVYLPRAFNNYYSHFKPKH